MADNEDREEATSRGNGWEVVSLTSSAYTAGQQVDVNTDMARRIEQNQAMFMSGHFVFPPSQHENLPLEPEEVEVHDIPKISESSFGMETKEEPREIDSFGKEQSMYTDSEFGSFYGETTSDGSTTYDQSTFIAGQKELSKGLLDSDLFNSSNNAKDDDELDNYKLPSGAWWKRGANAVYTRAKEANTFWTVFVAAAVMGLVVIGRRLHQENLEILHLKWRLSLDSEKVKKLLGPISRLKELKL